MADDPSRPAWRDAALVALLAIVLVAGLVYYGVRLARDSPAASSTVTPTVTPADAPMSATATPSSPGPTVEPGPEQSPSPSPSEPAPRPGTCWDGTATADVRACRLPEGVAGLAWVFPSFSPDRPQCRENPRTDRAFVVVTSWVCTERALGRDVLVAYDQVGDIEEVDAFLHASTPAGQITENPGARGGRCVARDTAKRPARITGWYEGFPYVVSVFAPTRAAAEDAWGRIVRQRSPHAVRGQRS